MNLSRRGAVVGAVAAGVVYAVGTTFSPYDHDRIVWGGVAGMVFVTGAVRP